MPDDRVGPSDKIVLEIERDTTNQMIEGLMGEGRQALGCVG